MEKNGINKMSGAKCRTDLERVAENIIVTVKCALVDFLLYFKLFLSNTEYKLMTLYKLIL